MLYGRDTSEVGNNMKKHDAKALVYDWEKFMLESNRIEGENRINPGDETAVEIALMMPNTLDKILLLHRTLGAYLKKDWVGKWRSVDVRVGNFVPASAENIHFLMKDYIEQIHLMDAWTAHNEFEKIHPFRDLNGRVGRLIWLSKMKEIPTISFLQMYYYQTLEKYENKEEAI